MAAPDRCRELVGVEACFGNPGKAQLAAWIAEKKTAAAAGETPPLVALSGELPITALRADARRSRSRVEIKIQDGCNSFCRYCIIPYLRGRCRSLPPEQVLAECSELAAAGFREIVLTGIHIGCYGDDLAFPPGRGLTRLLLALAERFPALRFRLGSLQPHEITPEIIALLLDVSSPLCEHLHLSLQSACDRVLAVMGRPYQRPEIENLLARLAPAAAAGRLNLGVDLIVGFPAEDAAAFAETRDFIAAAPFGYLHVFPYSPRPGTVAASWSGQVSPDEKRARAAELAALGREKRILFSNANHGRILEVLLESRRPATAAADAGWFGRSRNYLPVLLPATAWENESALCSGMRLRVRGRSPGKEASLLLGEPL